MRHTTIAAVAGAAGILLSAFFASCTIKTVPGDERPRSLERPQQLLSSQALPIPEITQAHAAGKDTVRNCDDVFEPGKITVNNSDFTVPAELETELLSIVARYRPYDTAFYAVDLASGMSIGFQADQYYMTACTIKAGYALSWFERLEQNRIDDENGVAEDPVAPRIRLDDTYVYTGADHLVGAGQIQYMGTGKTYTVQDLLYHLIHESDNTAYNVLYKKFGNKDYIALSERLGLVPYFGQYGMWTRMRPLDLGLVWQDIWRYYKTGSPEAQLYWEYLTTNLFCEIAIAVKDADVIAHKSGSDEYAFNEAGIVIRGDDAYALVVFTTRPLHIVGEGYDCCHEVIASLDRVMQAYYAQTGVSTAYRTT